MKPFIKRHKVRVQWQIDRVPASSEKAITNFSEDLAELHFTLGSLGQEYLKRGVYSWFKSNDPSQMLEDLGKAHSAITWEWKALANDGPHDIHLRDQKPFIAKRIEPNASVDFHQWLQGIYIAIILRDIGAAKVYGEADPEKVVRYGQNKPEPWQVPYLKFLNGIWAFDTQIGTYLKDALKGSDPTGYNTMRADWLLNMLSPLLELWAMVFTQNEDRFNEKLHEQQQIRHDWHAALGEDSSNSIMEYIDLGALAACCYAHDKGFKITVKSDYLPEFLIKGDFPKLEWPDPEWKS